MYYQVLQILADGKAHPIQQISQQLGLTPDVLKQAIDTLAAFGIAFRSPIQTACYQLTDAIELLEQEKILALLSETVRQQLAQLDIFPLLDSTNQYLLTRAHHQFPVACLAEYQTLGRGRQGRRWLSPYASGLCFSLKQRYRQETTTALSGLAIALGITVIKTLSALGVEELQLKWPNDVLWRGRKLAGLLLETCYHADTIDVVAGIGINIKIPRPDAISVTQPWVDLTTLYQHPFSRNQLAARLIESCLHTLTTYPQTGIAAFHAEWQRFDLLYGKTITLQLSPQEAQKITGIARGIDEQGALLLQVGTDNHRYVDGEVSLHDVNDRHW